MIKVGDYIKFNNKIDRVEEIVPTPNDKYMIYFENIDHGVLFDGLYESMIVDYKKMYEQQKLRADECCKVIDNLGRCAKLQEEKIDRLEKRWSELKKYFEKQIDKSYGLLHWSRCNGMLELMQQLEEDKNDI